MKKVIYLLFMLITYLSAQSYAQTAAVPNHAFQTGEKIRYDVFYNVMGIYFNAGTAAFTALTETMENSEVFHVTGEGATNSKYDWIFRVRDRYETYFTASNLKPLRFRKHINEGSYKKDEEIYFNQQTNSVTTNGGVYVVPENIQDVISIMYYVRDIDYSRYQTGSKIPISVFIDNKVYKMYIHYNSREIIKTKYGKFNAIKLKPILMKGNAGKDDEKLLEESVFEGSEKMTIWITDDSNHIPVRIESPIAVGKVKIDLMHYENLKYSLTALKR